jgi:hypothetical protein
MLWTVIAEPDCIGGELLYFAVSREFWTIVFGREQRASGRLCFAVSREPLDGCVLL